MQTPHFIGLFQLSDSLPQLRVSRSPPLHCIACVSDNILLAHHDAYDIDTLYQNQFMRYPPMAIKFASGNEESRIHHVVLNERTRPYPSLKGRDRSHLRGLESCSLLWLGGPRTGLRNASGRCCLGLGLGLEGRVGLRWGGPIESLLHERWSGPWPRIHDSISCSLGMQIN